MNNLFCKISTVFFLTCLLGCSSQQADELQRKLDDANKKIAELEQAALANGTLTEVTESIEGSKVKKIINSAGDIVLISIEDKGDTVFLKPTMPNNPNTINQLNCFISCGRGRRGCQDTKENCDNIYNQCRSNCGATVFAKQ